MEEMRAAFVNSMRFGDKLCFFVGEEETTFDDFSDEELFPIKKMLDWD